MSTWTEFDRGFLAGLAVARTLSPGVVGRIIEALGDAEGTRQTRAALAAVLADRPGGIVDGAVDGLLHALAVRAETADEGAGGDAV